MAIRSLTIAYSIIVCLFALAVDALSAPSPRTPPQSVASDGDGVRRAVLRGVGATMGAVLLSSNPQLASAASAKSRAEGYAVQRTDREWAYVLSGQQYNILREGGTERPYSSILEGEDRPGSFVCAGCGTPLFDSIEKFHSGTGWPSFAVALDGVEVEDVNPVQMSLAGAELRCHTCGGHLGDVFLDGKLFVGTPAFKSGKRFCIDGAALIFKPDDGSAEVYGDTPPPSKAASLPSFLEPPKINAR
jgi:peptide-methionine (R)-S-oxide reductase